MSNINRLGTPHDFLVKFDKIKGGLSSEQVEKIYELFPKDFPVAATSSQVSSDGKSNHVDLFLKTYNSSEALIKHYLGLDVWEHKGSVAAKMLLDAYTTDTESVDLSFQGLTTLPTGFYKLSQLKTVILTGNKLTKVPEEIGQMRQLKVLKVNENGLESFPSIVNLDALEMLDLSHNKLHKLPDPLFRSFKEALAESPTLALKREKLHLNFSHNQLTELPPDINNISCLKELDVSYNHLRNLPPGPRAWEGRLEYLNTRFNTPV